MKQYAGLCLFSQHSFGICNLLKNKTNEAIVEMSLLCEILNSDSGKSSFPAALSDMTSLKQFKLRMPF